jgi:hypothetical protein
MGTKSREVIFGSRVRGARIRAMGAREDAIKAVRAADRAEAEAWSIQVEAFGGPAQPSPTIGQCLNGGYCWLQVKCRRCETEASIPLEHVRRPRDTPIWKLEAFPHRVRSIKCVIVSLGTLEKVKLYKARHLVDLSLRQDQTAPRQPGRKCRC